MEQQCNNPSSSSSKADRKTIEKNRRNQMKALYLKLHSLVPNQQHSREVLSLPDQLEEAINYIKRLQIDLERMTQKKDSLKRGENSSSNSSCGRKTGLSLPHIEIHSVDSALQVVLTTGLDYQFIFTDVIRLLHEEGVQVINASYTLICDTIVHSIHSKMGECAPDQYGAARISERLKKFVGGC
ncbi:transcription factor bHLH162-like [Nicotiana tomentosiformis]|uniref:transcription factor bHLH162-like n=1 Tax=Nicotiana tomentosiformis TaxID=4098 RepID=UPI00051C576F|nr:transcription factor bHLH162-like [Nicotiana tomentosiformis]XP_016435311.1 PREDICTED: transcription factor bHLH55-like [Nicotiana tabacum]